MPYSALATVLIGLSALCVTSCSASRTTADKSVQFNAESHQSVEKVDSIALQVRDTLREQTTVTIQTNDKGDTLRITQITERERIQSTSDVRSSKSDARIERDTIYIENKAESNIRHQLPYVSPLKWIFWIILAIIGLTITLKHCH